MSFSVRNLFRRARAKVEIPGGDRRLAQRLVERGIAAETSGDAEGALRYYRSAGADDEDYAPGHMNLGIGLQAAGEFTTAFASYARAIEVDSRMRCRALQPRPRAFVACALFGSRSRASYCVAVAG